MFSPRLTPTDLYRVIPLDKVDSIEGISVSQDGLLLKSQADVVEDGELWIRWLHPLDPPETLTFEI